VYCLGQHYCVGKLLAPGARLFYSTNSARSYIALSVCVYRSFHVTFRYAARLSLHSELRYSVTNAHTSELAMI
jgi:hypothetical protein